MSLFNFTDSNFKKEVLESDLPVVVDFWALWCMPCKMIAPALEELAKEFQHKVKVGKLDIDANPRVPGQFGVMSIPTLMFFYKGKVLSQAVGALSKAELRKKIIESFDLK
ncbi:MAG: thioredoxin [Candidatus Omnitrophota bacterium]|nr:thioredoxin [Candidatus Omnitrophota bacterium]